MNTAKRLLLIVLASLIVFSLTSCQDTSDVTTDLPMEEAISSALATRHVGINVYRLVGTADVPESVIAEDQGQNYFIPKPSVSDVANNDINSNEIPDILDINPEDLDVENASATNPFDVAVTTPATGDTVAVPVSDGAVSSSRIVPIGPAPNVVVPQVDEPYVLVITGDGVSVQSTWTLSQLKSLHIGYRETTFSTTSSWPHFDRVQVKGISLPYLLNQAGVSANAASFKLVGSNGNYVIVTRSQMFGNGYAYTTHGINGSSGAVSVEPVVAWTWTENGVAGLGSFKSFFGQKGPLDVNTIASIDNLCQIEVSTTSPGSWTAPTASIPSGKTVSTGETLDFGHVNLDRVRIYYTLDGSIPDYNSNCYNPSASYLQPQVIRPLKLMDNVTVTAFASAYGMDTSPVATFTYTVEKH